MTTFIMSEDRPQQIADGVKTITCRPVKAGDVLREHYPGLRDAVITPRGTRWTVGNLYGIKPARTAPVCLVGSDGKVVTDYHDRLYTLCLYSDAVWELSLKQARDVLLEADVGYSLLQLRVLQLAQVDIREMTPAIAAAAGFAGKGESTVGYWEFWLKAYDPHAFNDKAVHEHRVAYHITKDCSYEQYFVLLEARLWERPADLYKAWQIRFERAI